MELTIEQALQQGVAAHKEGRLQEAERLYRSILQTQPKHPDANHNLGVLAISVNKSEAALPLFKTAVEVNPKIEQFWLSYIDALIKEKQFEDAKRALKKVKKSGLAKNQLNALTQQLTTAIKNPAPHQSELKSLLEHYQNGRYEDAEKLALILTDKFRTHPFGWKMLGAVLNQTGRISEGLIACQKSVALAPENAEAHYNLGNTLHKLGRFKEAEESCRKAIALAPENAKAHYNLGNTLKEFDRLEEAEESYRKAIELKPEYVEAMLNLSNLLDYMNNLEEAILLLENILKMDEDIYRLKSAVNLAIFRFLEDDFITSKKHLSEIQKTLYLDSNTYLIYWEYLLKILSSHDNKSHDNLDFITKKKLYVIGESHALVSHGLHIKISSDNFICKSLLIKGCMQWHLGSALKNQYKNKFEGIFHSLRKSSEVLLAIGEIDCRLNSGIIKHKNKFPEKNITQLISTTVENYLNYIYKINSSCEHKIIIQGVPCPNISTKNIPKEKVMELINLIREFNILLKNKSTEIGFGFLDVYKLTDRGDGFCNQSWHIDEYHLSPEGIHEAWRIHSAN